MNLFQASTGGVGTPHPPKSFHRNYRGPSTWLIMCFHTDFVYYKDKHFETGRQFQCLINAPGSPTVHGPTADMKTGFENDWLYFSGEGVDELISALNLPVNQAFSVQKERCLTPFISTILKEQESPLPYAQFMISNTIADMLLFLARNRHEDEVASNKAYRTIHELRTGMLENYTESYDLKSLAEKSGYSVSRFCELYKQFYHSSPISDLVNIRISHAKNYLLFSDRTISEIAILCGFDSIHYFSNMFKKIVKCSPKQFRDSLLGRNKNEE